MTPKPKDIKGKERMLFSTFLALETNRKAKTIAKSFLKNDKTVLVINGPIASGKTHLAMSVVNRYAEFNEEPFLLCSGMNVFQWMQKILRCEEGPDVLDDWFPLFFDSWGLICIDNADILFNWKNFFQYGQEIINYIIKDSESLKERNKKIVFVLADDKVKVPGQIISLDYPSSKELSMIYDRIVDSLESGLLTAEDKIKILSKKIRNFRELEGTVISVNAKRMLNLPSRK